MGLCSVHINLFCSAEGVMWTPNAAIDAVRIEGIGPTASIA
jgi:hypothetical protein